MIRAEHTEISTKFTGIGILLVDLESLVQYTNDYYDLDVRSLPLLSYRHFISFILCNLQTCGFKTVVLCAKRPRSVYEKCVAAYLKKVLRDVTKIVDEINERYRVALVLGHRDAYSMNFLRTYMKKNVVCGLLEDLEFRVPYVHVHILSAAPPESAFARSSDAESDESDSEIDETAVDYARMKRIYENGSFDFVARKAPVAKSVCKFLLREIDNDDFFFDGRIVEDVGDATEPIAIGDLSLSEVPLSQSRFSEIDYKLTKTEEKRLKDVQIYSKYLSRAAKSLYTTQLYNAIGKAGQKKAEKEKISPKQQALIRENQSRIDEENREKERNFIRNFYQKYKMSTSLQKRVLLDRFVESKSVRRRILLLRIEFYFEEWSLEKRKEKPDETVLVPCYLACLEFLDLFAEGDARVGAEIKYVIDKLVECGFKSTAAELNARHCFGLDVPHSPAPDDLDLYFQMRFAGDKLKRSTGSKKDKRVLFEPDRWQIDLLDLVDANKSVVVSAPTSSGKTFICFYAIEKILRANDTDLIVFCLPTKALVNQVSIDIYARFNTKLFTRKDMVLQGQLLRDYQINAMNCQVLLTIPSMLEAAFDKLRDRIKYVIIDEIHLISNEEMGVSIERIIHLSNSPLLLLSATLNNVEGFYEWVKTLENGKGRECALIVYKERYCDLKLHVYSNGLDDLNPLFAYSFEHIKELGFSNDFSFLPEEVLEIYYAIYASLHRNQRKLIQEIRPQKFFSSNLLTKADVLRYERFVLAKFKEWVDEAVLTEDQVYKVYDLLTKDTVESFDRLTKQQSNEKEKDNEKCETYYLSEEYLLENILDLCTTLKEKDLLPCIFFNLDRETCNKLAKRVYEDLENAEKREKTDKGEEKMKERLLKEMKRNRDEEKKKDAWIEESIQEEENMHLLKSTKKNVKFTFLTIDKLSDYELEEQTRHLKKTEHGYVDMLWRGIGVHHNGMNKSYRGLVEILFRLKHLQVVFSTETLSLGINMPCRTVVFAGDSLDLNPLSYKQMAGRAGRRSFDTLGNVVFYGISKEKAQNLIISSLPDLKGPFSYCYSSFMYNISGSILDNPLFLVNYNSPGHNFNEYNLSTVFSDRSEREAIIASKIRYLHRNNIMKDNKFTYLSDVLIINKDCDMSVVVFVAVLESQLVDLNNRSLVFELIFHLFAVKPVVDKKGALKPLPEKIEEFITKIASDRTLESVIKKNELHSLQFLNHNKPLLFSLDFKFYKNKSSYLSDYLFENKRENVAELFKGLCIVDGVLKSILNVFEKYGIKSDERKILVSHYGFFKTRFLSIHA